ncbi:MAG: 30S ribosomal protein S12 methylthiotransferase RimO [Candidatus Saccharicenans sp.]|jgi:ribosomal protein S12 methylthiotransferase|nr:30S ribosomal protein S12 methylthiotransferase RimO [Candidatus Saccharicenans sp.]MDH7493365.1 30S ribosomal protein S12 methylthiotransferase RimO [Candidatus Saccharicenans sp.]
MPKVSLITLGCAKNLVDSEVMLARLDQKGYSFSADLDQAEILIINTCGFISPAREEAHQAIEQGLLWKSQKAGRLLVVVGCYVERAPDYLRVRYPGVDIWSGVSSFDRIDDTIEKKRDLPGRGTFLLDHRTPRVITTGPHWAYVKISEGCSHRCAFCSIPLIKGPYKSRTIESVVREVRNLAALGIKEINLISHDTTYFGRDRKKPGRLVSLLRKLLAVKGIEWIRLLYGYPEEVDDSLLELMLETKMCRYLDLPFQHASRPVLQAMGRGLDGPRALRLLEKIRNKVPGVVIRSSLIVGFPTEGKKEFKELQAFVARARFEHLGVFCYSSENGTPAARLGDRVPETEKKRRQQAIMLQQREISREFYRTFLGQKLEVIIESPLPERPGFLAARARFQAPEVDGRVLVQLSPELHRKSLPPFLPVVISRSLDYDLMGKMNHG